METPIVRAATAMSSARGPITGGGVVTITGPALVVGMTEVRFGGQVAEIVEHTSAASVQVRVPPATRAGSVDVAVTTPGGTSPNTSVDNYVYRAR